ncbi:hypothetical protein ES703_61689 [subsurface metagenome]
MVGAYAGGNVGTEVFSADSRSVSIDNLALAQSNLAQHGSIAVDDPGKVHNLSQTDGLPPA